MPGRVIVVCAALVAATSPAFAAHNNPWATATDDVKSQFHDENQARSVDTPGEDEMRGSLGANRPVEPGPANRAGGPRN